MTQPTWRLEWATDCTALYVDTTGVYTPELEVLEHIYDADPSENHEVYRACLDRCKVIDGHLVSAKYEPTWPHPLPSYVEWFAKDLASVAQSMGREEKDIIDGLCSADPSARAGAYQDIAGYHGWMNFDGYPLRIAEYQAEEWPDWRAAVEPEPETPEPEECASCVEPATGLDADGDLACNTHKLEGVSG